MNTANKAAVDEQTQSFCRKPWQHDQVPFAGRNRDKFSEVTAIRGCNNGYQTTAYLNVESHFATKKIHEMPTTRAIRELEPCGNSQARGAGLQVSATWTSSEFHSGSPRGRVARTKSWELKGILHKTRRYRPHVCGPQHHGASVGADLTRIHTGKADYFVAGKVP